MAFYPIHKELQNISRHMQKGNFSLWFNKFIPLNNQNECKPSDDKENKDSENSAVDHYFNMYGKMKNNAADMLKQKHADMDDFGAGFPSDKYEEIVICATLNTPLITGIGESHPHEVSMVFDHNMGIPYIPASGLKGIVRFAHTLSLWKEGIPTELITTDQKTSQDSFDDDNYEPVYSIFGNQKNCGRVVFLDAYPNGVPDLHIDIMNPHYSPYYIEGKAPADHYNPTPIKFLTVAKETTFIFRAVAEKKENMPEKVRAAFIKALTEEGVGAKTAVGYGRFQIDEKKKETLMADRKKRRKEDEDRQFPWRAHLERIKGVTDWGPFRQIVIDNAKLREYCSKKEVAEAVQAKALEIRQKGRKSWESKRDDEIAIWLAPSGLSWQALAMETKEPLEEKSEECKRLEGLRDWGAFKSSGISSDALQPDALKLLQKKMEEWECNSKKAKDDKKQAYRHVKDLLKRA